MQFTQRFRTKNKFKKGTVKEAVLILIGVIITSVLGIISAYYTVKNEENTKVNNEEAPERPREPQELELEIPANKFDWYKQQMVEVNKFEIDRENNVSATLSSTNGDKLTITKVINQVDTGKLIEEIKTILGEEENLYSVYVYDFARNQEIYYRQNDIRYPASISKLPVAMLILKDIQESKYTLSTKIKVEGKHMATVSNVLGRKDIGKSYKIDEYMHWLLIDSDNVSVRVLEDFLGGSNHVNKRTREELGVDPFFRDPHEVTAKNIGRVLRMIYAGDFLNKVYREYILTLMLSTPKDLQEELPTGFPSGTKFAHKTGRIWPSGGGVSFNDAGIVFGPKSDFVIVYLNQNVSIENAQSNAKKIAELIYSELQN